jgi:hypothetical protein
VWHRDEVVNLAIGHSFVALMPVRAAEARSSRAWAPLPTAVYRQLANVQPPHVQAIDVQCAHAAAFHGKCANSEPPDGERADRRGPYGKRAECNRAKTESASGAHRRLLIVPGLASRRLYLLNSSLANVDVVHGAPRWWGRVKRFPLR